MIEVAVDGYVPAQKTAGGTERSGPGAGGDRGPGRGPGRVCTSLQEALDLLEEDPALERLILVYPGIYREQVTVRVPGVTIQAVPFDDLGRDRETGTDRAGADRTGADRAGADRAGADRTGAEGQVAADRVPGVPQQETAGVGDQAAGRGADGSWGDVIVTWGLGAKEVLEDGKKRGTFRTYTFFVDADDVTLKGLTIENHAGPGTQVGQAIALYADGDRLVVDSCRLLGWQDTLFTAPLPPVEIEKDGFIGPKQSAPRRENRQYYKDCYIEGEVDFIFGGATAYFETCTFFSKDVDREVKGYVTAPSTPEGLPFGYVMEGCRFRSNCPDRSVYLGRPWREWGRAVLLRCVIGPHIKAEGWVTGVRSWPIQRPFLQSMPAQALERQLLVQEQALERQPLVQEQPMDWEQVPVQRRMGIWTQKKRGGLPTPDPPPARPGAIVWTPERQRPLQGKMC